YQKEGFKWLHFLRDYGFSGCLADDMGLGKTVQTLALLQTLKDKNLLKTSLLVAPVSALPNWEMEIEKFTPGLRFYRHMGSKREKDTVEWHKVDLVITSYATLRNDIDVFNRFEFDHIILDESQNIKNHSSQVSRAIKILKGNRRLALSGTPIENNTMELWSLFDFLMPGYLGTPHWFTQQFASAIERDKDSQRVDLLKKMIYPFILRRKKGEVEAELPEKTEIVSKLRMEDEQLKLYVETAKYYREELEKEMDEKGVSKSSIKILEGMLRLRQLCLFPRLMDEKFGWIPSAKFDHFTELMEDILAEDHKVLVFSQFVAVLKILKSYFDEAGMDYSYIDGATPIADRGRTVKEFQEDHKRRVFLLSLKAGGVALNLTAADYVVIFDPWWNPAVEAQAIDRSHRIGQTKKVLVYRMVMEGSIEEKMLQLQEEKRNLVENLITSDTKTFKNLKKEDILSLFTL
ncbi:MAG TPA: DEAD/DEAH box helicase, partial [Candidatus Kapabacteria bacterium]|nr:DEAD/DEAH box helicase [Candidatus Kapabacteria bacterium]